MAQSLMDCIDFTAWLCGLMLKYLYFSHFFFHITRTSDADDIWLAKLSDAHSHSVACCMQS